MKNFKDKNGNLLAQVYTTNEIVANPQLSGDEPELQGVQIGDQKYKAPQGGGGGSDKDLYIFEVWFQDNAIKFLSPVPLFEGEFYAPEQTVLSAEQLASLNAYIAYLQSQEPEESMKSLAMERGIVGYSGMADVTTQVPVMGLARIAEGVLTLTCYILSLEVDRSQHTVSYASVNPNSFTIDLATGQLGGNNIQQGMAVNFKCTKI